MKKVLGGFAALLLTCLSTQAKSTKDISNYVARDAMAVLRINDLNKLNKEAFSIGGMPMDLSSMALMQLGNFSGNGFDKTRPVAAVLTSLKPEPQFYFVLPVTDAKTFQESCELPETANMQAEGNYVLVNLNGKLPLSFDNKLSGNSKSLLSLHVDAAKMVKTHQSDIIGGLTLGRMSLAKEMDQSAQETGIDANTISQLTGTYFDVAQEFVFSLNDLQIDLDSTGGFVTMTNQASFKSKSSFARFCNTQKNSALIDASKINNGMMSFSGTVNYGKTLEAFQPFIDKLMPQITDKKFKEFLTSSLNDWKKIGTVESAAAINMLSLEEFEVEGFAKHLDGAIDWRALTRKGQENPFMKEISESMNQEYLENVDQLEGKPIDSLKQTIDDTISGEVIEQNFYYLYDKSNMFFTMGQAYKESFTDMLNAPAPHGKNKGLVHFEMDLNKLNTSPVPFKFESLISVKENGIVKKAQMNLKGIVAKFQNMMMQQMQGGHNHDHGDHDGHNH